MKNGDETLWLQIMKDCPFFCKRKTVYNNGEGVYKCSCGMMGGRKKWL